MRHALAFVVFGVAAWADELPHQATAIPELIARSGTQYTNVTVTRRDRGRVSFSHDNGMTTLPLSAFDDINVERLIPGHLASLKAKQDLADAKERERESTRNGQRKQALEQNPAAEALARKEDDIREAAIRCVLTHFEPPDLNQVAVIFAEIDMDTPSDEFLKRFAGHTPTVQKMPRSRRRDLRKNELSCSVGNLKWLSEIEAEINVGRLGWREGVAFVYTVRLTTKGWEIVKSRITAIS